jgi:hypothetical protein
MKLALSLCCVMLALLLPPRSIKNQSEPAFRTINIYASDNGYNYFDSMAITSSQDFKTFLEEVSQHQLYWSNKEAFVNTLLNANVDFNREALVLLRYTDPYGAARVPFETPVLKEKTLVCEIHREVLGAGLGIVGYHGFALAVSKSVVERVEWKAVVGAPNQQVAPILLSTNESQPLKVRRDPPPPPKPLPGECPKLILGCPNDVLETGKTYLLKLVVEGGILKDDVTYNWSVTGAEIVGGQGTRGLAVRIKNPNEIVTTWVSLGGVNPYCEAVTNCSCGPTR